MSKQRRGPGFICLFCNRYFNGTCDQTIHIRRHIQEKPYNCPHCDFTAVCPNDINCHVRNRHPSTVKFQCNLCPKSFANERYLRYHFRQIHLGMKRKYSRKSNQKIHKCDFCGREFNLKCTLVNHRGLHTGEKPYECQECGSAFVTKGNLNQHVTRSHRGERRFGCERCGREYFTKQSLKKHEGKSEGKCEPRGVKVTSENVEVMEEPQIVVKTEGMEEEIKEEVKREEELILGL